MEDLLEDALALDEFQMEITAKEEVSPPENILQCFAKAREVAGLLFEGMGLHGIEEQGVYMSAPEFCVQISLQKSADSFDETPPENGTPWQIIVDQTEMVFDEVTGQSYPKELKREVFPASDWMLAGRLFVLWACESKLNDLIETLSIH